MQVQSLCGVHAKKKLFMAERKAYENRDLGRCVDRQDNEKAHSELGFFM